MARPYTISVIEDVAAASTSSILRNSRGITLVEPSRIQLYANRESTEITMNITVGADIVLEDGFPTVLATAGIGPIVPDDIMVDSFGDTGDEIIVRARNTAAADAREARVLIRVTPIGDIVPGGS